MEVVKLLLLGESGTGKSTFINSFANYFRNGSFAKAIAREPVCLIPAQFSIVDGNFEVHFLDIGNTDVAVGSSVTQDPKEYIIDVDQLRVHIIDTPGVGDTRGIEKDMENINRTMAYVAGCDQLHAICFLLPPNVSVLNKYFKFCITSLLSIVHADALQNIIFVFTNTRSTFYRPGDTHMLLKRLLSEDESMYVPCSKQNMFCVDNEAFRYLVASTRGISLTDNDMDAFAQSWEVSSQACGDILNYICEELKPHKIKTVLTEEHALTIAEDIFPVLVDALVTLKLNMNAYTVEYELHNPTTIVEMVPLDEPFQVCNHFECLEIQQCNGELLIAHDETSLTLHSKCVHVDYKCSLCNHDIARHHLSHYKKVFTIKDDDDGKMKTKWNNELLNLMNILDTFEKILEPNGLTFQDELHKNIISEFMPYGELVIKSLLDTYNILKPGRTIEEPVENIITKQMEKICRLKYVGKAIFYIKSSQDKHRRMREQELRQQKVSATVNTPAIAEQEEFNSVNYKKRQNTKKPKDGHIVCQNKLTEKITSNKLASIPQNISNRSSMHSTNYNLLSIPARDVTELQNKLKKKFDKSVILNSENVRTIVQMVLENVDLKKFLPCEESANATKVSKTTINNSCSYNDALKKSSRPNTRLNARNANRD